MARPIAKRRKQVVLMRDANGEVMYDRTTGKPLIEKTIKRSRRAKGSFVDKVESKSGAVKASRLTPEELEQRSPRTPARPETVPPVENPTFSPFSRRKSSPVSK